MKRVEKVEGAKALKQNSLPDKCQEISKGESKVLKRDPNSRSSLGSPISVSIPELQHTWALPNPAGKTCFKIRLVWMLLILIFSTQAWKVLWIGPGLKPKYLDRIYCLLRQLHGRAFLETCAQVRFWGHGKSRFNDQLERPGQMCSFRCCKSAIPLCSCRGWRGVLLEWIMDSKKTVSSKSTVY